MPSRLPPPRRVAPAPLLLGLLLAGCFSSRRLPVPGDAGPNARPDAAPTADAGPADAGPGDAGTDGGGADAGRPPSNRTLGDPYRGEDCLLWSEQPILGSPSSVIATAEGFFLSSPVQRFDGRAWQGWPLSGPVLLGPDGLVALDAGLGAVGFWTGDDWSLVALPDEVGAPTAGAVVGGRLVVGGATHVAERVGADWRTLPLPDAGALLALGALRVDGTERIVAALEDALYWRGDDAWNGISPFRGVVALGTSRTSPLFGVRAGELFEVLRDGLRRVSPNGDRCRPASLVASDEALSVVCGARVFRWVGRDADDDGPRDGWTGEGELPREAIPSLLEGQSFGVDVERGGLVGRSGSDRDGEPAPWRFVPGGDEPLDRLPTVSAPPVRVIGGDPRGVPVVGGDGVFRIEDGALVVEPGTVGWQVDGLWTSPEGVPWAVTRRDPPMGLGCVPVIECEGEGFRCLPDPSGVDRCVPRIEVHRRAPDGVWRVDLTVFPTPLTSGAVLSGVGEAPRLVTGCGVRVRGDDGAWSPRRDLPELECGSSVFGGDPEEQLVRGGLAAGGDVLVFGEPGRIVFDPDAVRVNPHVRYDLARDAVDARFDDAGSWPASLLGEVAHVLLDRDTDTLWIDGAEGLVRVPAPEGRVLGGTPTGEVLLYRAAPPRLGLWSPAAGSFGELTRDGFVGLLADTAPGGERAIVNGDAVLAVSRVDQAWFLQPAGPPRLLHCPGRDGR